METITAADLLFSATTPSLAMIDNMAASSLGRGIDAFMAKNYTAAVREFRRSISLSPFSENALNAFEYMAQALGQSGRIREAVTAYKEAIRVFPSADGLNLSLGNLLFAEGRQEEALEQYQAAVRKNPVVSGNVYALGQGYLALEQYGKAEETFKQVIGMSPRDSAGYYALGQTYRMMGRWDEAEEQLQKALAMKKDFGYVHYELGMVYAQRQEMAKAREELEIVAKKARELFPDLQLAIERNAAPRFILAYTGQLNLSLGPGTKVSSLAPSLAEPGATGEFTMRFVFDKAMDAASVRNVMNWEISRSSSLETGGSYNWGRKVPASEVNVALHPVRVLYDPELLTARVTFRITQNADGNGTIDLSHLVFSFRGTDVHGNVMDPEADQYNRFSRIV
ncbi:MAG: tetratricopeptide repeat protein [Deltaproteobacteria bacterium]|jgi:tetratricopeptide (TPR) repeat protein|nr:tetratricopeptide repeat protein [Deltaproteobacteria bacterium]